VGLERGPLSLVNTIEELLERKSIGSGPEIRDYGRRDLSRLPRGTFYPQTLALTSPTSGGRSIGIVRSRTNATEFIVLAHVQLQRVSGYSPLYSVGLDPYSLKTANNLRHAGLHHLTRAVPPAAYRL
jgi:hypothetical protein